MNFLDDSLPPENWEALAIRVAPFGPQRALSASDDLP